MWVITRRGYISTRSYWIVGREVKGLGKYLINIWKLDIITKEFHLRASLLNQWKIIIDWITLNRKYEFQIIKFQ
mgnify:CR=1 FL=1